MGFLGGLTKTISGVAKSALGSVSQVRKVLNANPLASGLVFPPQVSLGLKAASLVGGAIGLKVPTEKDILGFASGKLDQVLGGIRSKVKTPLDIFEKGLKSVTAGAGRAVDFATKVFSKITDLSGLSASEIVNRISWLL